MIKDLKFAAQQRESRDVFYYAIVGQPVSPGATGAEKSDAISLTSLTAATRRRRRVFSVYVVVVLDGAVQFFWARVPFSGHRAVHRGIGVDIFILDGVVRHRLLTIFFLRCVQSDTRNTKSVITSTSTCVFVHCQTEKMATAVPSRFAVLSIEDDDYKPKKTQKSATTSKTNVKNKGDKPKQQQQQQQQANKKKQNKVRLSIIAFLFLISR